MENHKLDPTLHVTDEESEDQRGKGTCPCTDDQWQSTLSPVVPWLGTILVNNSCYVSEKYWLPQML